MVKNSPTSFVGTSNVHFAHKYDQGKLRFDLIDPYFEADLAEVLTQGVVEYGEYSWKDVPDAINRYKAALRRHYNAIDKGEIIDPKSNLPHTSHITANAMFLHYLLPKQ